MVPTEELEANIVENKRSAEMLELQETLCWPSLSQLEPGAYIPEVCVSVSVSACVCVSVSVCVCMHICVCMSPHVHTAIPSACVCPCRPYSHCYPVNPAHHYWPQRRDNCYIVVL